MDEKEGRVMTSTAQSRLARLASHLFAAHSPPSPPAAAAAGESVGRPNRHELSPTYLLPRAASIEPLVRLSVPPSELHRLLTG